MIIIKKKIVVKQYKYCSLAYFVPDNYSYFVIQIENYIFPCNIFHCRKIFFIYFKRHLLIFCLCHVTAYHIIPK